MSHQVGLASLPYGSLKVLLDRANESTVAIGDPQVYPQDKGDLLAVQRAVSPSLNHWIKLSAKSDTVDLENAAPHNSSVMAETLRVETPLMTVSNP
ncbi:UNVERIFIED_CONTAM: hypothetical protein ABIC26_004984 [Paenibacillus sp. PvR008]